MLSWETLFGVGVVLLGFILAYGLYRNATRNKANDRVTEAATKQLYDEPERYAEGGRERLKEELRPN